MGYTDTLPYQQLTLFTSLRYLNTIDTTPSAYDIAQFTIPDFIKPIDYAYVDLHVMCIQDTSGAINYIDLGAGTCYFGLWDSSHSSFYSSNSISDGTFYVAANEKANGLYTYPGATNLYNRIEPGTNQYLGFTNIYSHGDDLLFRGVCGSMRLYFAI